MKNKELGKGIKALIRDHSTAKKTSGQNIFIKIKDIIPNRDNPRENFDKKDLKELKDSILKHGILQPLTVRELSDGKYELIFYIGDYFKTITKLDQLQFLDDVVVRFGISNNKENYHVPLLVSPWSYSTYRGS